MLRLHIMLAACHPMETLFAYLVIDIALQLQPQRLR